MIVDGMGWMGKGRGGERVVFELRKESEVRQFALLRSWNQNTDEE